MNKDHLGNDCHAANRYYCTV